MQGDRKNGMGTKVWMAMWIVGSLAGVVAAAPVNDDCSQAIELTLISPYEGTTVGATGGSVSSCSYYDFYDVWYSFTAPRLGAYEFLLENYTFSPSLAVYDACGGAELACNGQLWSNPGILLDLQAGQTCFLRIAGEDEQTGDFTISVNYRGPSLDLRSPLGGSQWLVGLPVRIAWDTQASVETVRLEYSADGGAHWNDIATVANVGHYEWPAPAASGNQYMIRISDATDPTVSDSTELFSVIPGDCDQFINYARGRLIERSISGLRAAEAALDRVLSRPECVGIDRQREAQFLHALTRIVLLVFADDAVEPQSALEVARLFGVELVEDMLGDVDVIYPTNNHDYYEIPAGAPDYDGIRQILHTSTVPELNAILAELDLITETPADRFQVWFIPEETRLSNPVEVDFAEVLILRSVLKWAKAWILAESAYDQNMTEEDQELLMQKTYGNAVSINLDILNKYPNFLKVLPTAGHPENGKAMLADARKSVTDAMQDVLDCVAYMESEDNPAGTDPQNDELLFIDGSNQAQVDSVRQRLTMLRNSLLNDTVAVMTFDEEREYQLTDPSKPGRTWTLDWESFDPFDRPTEGEFWTDDWDVPSSWTITAVEFMEDRFLVELNLTWGWGSGTLEGTLSQDKQQITDATFEYWTSWMGSGKLEGLSGMQTESTVNEMKFNLNPIFGSTTKYPNPVSPRNMLPTFTNFNWVVPNTMGTGLGYNPTLGGILPDMTQADWNDAFNARPAAEYPAGTIAGTIQFPAWIDEPIYIQAYTDPTDYEGALTSTMITQPGAYTLKGLTVGQTVYIRAFVPLFGFKIFELGAFEIEDWTKVQMTSAAMTGVNLTLQRPILMANGTWYSGSLNSELAFRRHYAFEAVKDQKYCFQLDRTAIHAASILLYGRDGQTELVERFEWQEQEIVDWICPVDGVYYIKVFVPEWNPWMLYTGTYRLRMVVPTPDLNNDGCVDIGDLALVAGHWLSGGCELSNDFCDGMDLDHNGQIDMIDFSLVAAEWKKCVPTIPEGLIAYWPMDDNAAGKTVLDAGDNHLNGAAQRNTSLLTTPGVIGTALSFNGTTDWIDCGTHAALLPDAWTLCAWVKCTNATTPMLISFGGSYPSIKLQNTSDGKPRIHLGQYNYRYFAASAWTTLKDGQWHHVAFTVPGKAQTDITQAQMYVDGIAVAGDPAVTTGAQAAKTHVYLGANPPTGTQRFGGATDDVMLFNRVLSATEINQIKNRQP